MITLQIITVLLLSRLISTLNETELFQYTFYRNIKEPKFKSTRRIFGGDPVQLNEFPAVCALVDRNTIVRCSGTVVSEYWVLTAAHCVTSNVAFIKYDSRWSNDVNSKSSPVQYMYRHPDYSVKEEDVGRGIDVTLLHHDIGMVQTQSAMTLTDRPSISPIISMKRFNPLDLRNEEVRILGFGQKDQDELGDLKGEQLFGVTLQLKYCERGSWFHCICGTASQVERSRGGRGVCSGDSGGPVLYRGVLIAVTSMGPKQCKRLFNSNLQGSTSVFTTLYQYANLINTTIQGTENVLREPQPSAQQHPAKSKCNSSVLHYILYRLSVLLCVLSSGIKYL